MALPRTQTTFIEDEDEDTSIAPDDIAQRGFRQELVHHPDGTEALVAIPLTEAEFLHPEEGYHLPNSTFHDTVIADVCDMLRRRYADDPTVGVFSDLIIVWDHPLMRNNCPDVCVMFGLDDRNAFRETFVVGQESVRPTWILEVVSPAYRHADRVKNVAIYARGGVQEYVIVDRRARRGQVWYEMLGYRLVGGHYQPIPQDSAGWLECRTLGLKITMQGEQIAIQDSETGERLLTSVELDEENRHLKAQLAALQAQLAQQREEQ